LLQWLFPLIALLAGCGGTVILFRSDLRVLTANFDSYCKGQEQVRDADRKLLDEQFKTVNLALKDIRGMVGASRRESDSSSDTG
jgi:hypothetical protein